MNYKNIIAIFLISSLCYSLNAQQRRNNPRKERIESLRVAFLTKELNLAPEESKIFWPLYNEMEDKIKQLKSDSRQVMRQIRVDNEDRAREVIRLRLESEQKVLDLKKQYINRLLDEITAEKIVRLSEAENSFKKELLREVRKRNNR